MSATIAAKIFLVSLSWFPVGHAQHGFVEHRYKEDYAFSSPEVCLAVAQVLMEKPEVDWTQTDMGCTHVAPIGKNMVFYLPENVADNWESTGFFIIPE